jgi:hypothetical protein
MNLSVCASDSFCLLKAIISLPQVIKKKAPSCGMWSALQVFGVAMSHKSRLSPQFEGKMAVSRAQYSSVSF